MEVSRFTWRLNSLSGASRNTLTPSQHEAKIQEMIFDFQKSNFTETESFPLTPSFVLVDMESLQTDLQMMENNKKAGAKRAYLNDIHVKLTFTG